jgi:hypothetical protein
MRCIARWRSVVPFPDQAFFDAVYDGEAPWDIGDAQPDLFGDIPALAVCVERIEESIPR